MLGVCERYKIGQIFLIKYLSIELAGHSWTPVMLLEYGLFSLLLLKHKEQETKRKQQTKVFMPKGRDLETERVPEVCKRVI